MRGVAEIIGGGAVRWGVGQIGDELQKAGLEAAKAVQVLVRAGIARWASQAAGRTFAAAVVKRVQDVITATPGVGDARERVATALSVNAAIAAQEWATAFEALARAQVERERLRGQSGADEAVKARDAARAAAIAAMQRLGQLVDGV